MQGSFSELAQIIHEKGLLQPQYSYYIQKFLIAGILLGSSIAILYLTNNILFVFANAIFLSFIFVQLGMIMHDADHQQIFKSKKKNELAGLFVGNVLLGISSALWTKRHNVHHSNPNDEDMDPDIDISVLAYSEKQALEKRGISRYITKYQVIFWLPLTTLQSFRMRYNYLTVALGNVLKKPNSSTIVEFGALLLSISLYFGIVFTALSLWKGLFFVLAHQMITGLYLGTVFATNHKGMPLMKEEWDFLHRQVLTTRNVRQSALIDYWTGCLNLQIEHHLFPTMPRNNLSKAKPIIEKYCKDNDIPYYETGFFQSYKEILQNFHEQSAVLRPAGQRHVVAFLMPWK